MKVYVCIASPGYGDSDYPVRVYSQERVAQAWKALNPAYREYEEFEVDGE